MKTPSEFWLQMMFLWVIAVGFSFVFAETRDEAILRSYWQFWAYFAAGLTFHLNSLDKFN